jgi:hypothetical protein
MTMASYLAENLADCSILVLTDLSIVGRFKFPQNVDYVHLPGIGSKFNSNQYTGNLNIELDETLTIRRKSQNFSTGFFHRRAGTLWAAGRNVSHFVFCAGTFAEDEADLGLVRCHW